MARRRAIIVVEYDSDHGFAEKKWDFKLAKGGEYRPPMHNFSTTVLEDQAMPGGDICLSKLENSLRLHGLL